MMKKELVCAQPHRAISMALSIELASDSISLFSTVKPPRSSGSQNRDTQISLWDQPAQCVLLGWMLLYNGS